MGYQETGTPSITTINHAALASQCARGDNYAMTIPMSVESFVRITYTKPENELTEVEKAARERLETAINQGVEQFHEETPGTDGLIAIEMYPCDFEKCEAA